MATMNISLPDAMRDWVEKQLESGLYANNSDYVRDLIRKDQQRAEKAGVEQAWATEIERRIAEVDTGAVRLLDADEVIESMLQRIRSRQ